MPDRVDAETRSRIMSKIRSMGTKAELAFAEALSSQGISGFEQHKKMLGNPDFVFLERKIAVFIDGDFWHGYNWVQKGKAPPEGYWQEKIRKNMDRDRAVTQQLESEGWIILRFWEHEIKSEIHACIFRLKEALSENP